MAKIFLTSDLHLNHRHIIEYCSRPFKDIEEMNTRIISNWNSIVADEDTVYIIGDIAFGNKGKIREQLSQLKGKKILIRGNHDRLKNLPLDCFEKVEKQFVILEYDEQKYVLIHDPSAASADYSTEYLYFCGHLHSKKEDRIYRNWVDIGQDGNDYYPIQIDEAIKLFKKN